MRKKMEKLVKKLNTQIIYFTENPVNLNDKWQGCRYFLVWQNTHQIYRGFHTQIECVEALQELFEDPIIWVNGHGFKAVKDI